MATVLAPADRVILHNVSWKTYEGLLDENIDNCGTRFTYDDGELEIMTTSLGHEHVNRTLADIVRITAQETGRPFVNAGSTTFRQQDKAKGFEPDTCFYFRHAKEVRRKRAIDPFTDPAPELVIEVDISHSSLGRFRIYAAFGVTEIWGYDGERVLFYMLEGQSYREIAESVTLPAMTAVQASAFLAMELDEDDNLAWEHTVREWLRQRPR